MTTNNELVSYIMNLTEEQAEAKLLDLIRNNEKPERALHIAVEIITDYLKRCESSK